MSYDENNDKCKQCKCKKLDLIDEYKSICVCAHDEHSHMSRSNCNTCGQLLIEKQITLQENKIKVGYTANRQSLIQKVFDYYRVLESKDEQKKRGVFSDVFRHISNGYIAVSLVLERSVVNSIWFTTLFDVLILLSVVTLILENLFGKGSIIVAILGVMEIIFVSFFGTEIVLKLIALGRKFFSSGWNIFDMVIVIGSFLSIALPDNIQNIMHLRSLRILRPLRTINRFPSLSIISSAFFSSFREMLDVFQLIIFLMVIFSIVALHLWDGVLHQRCYENQYSEEPVDHRHCNMGISHFGGKPCPDKTECIAKHQNPDFGLIGFDNFATSFLTIFVITTMEDWVPIMYNIRDAWGTCWIFFFLVIFVNSYYSMTLVIGVMLDEIIGETAMMESEVNKEMTNAKRRLQQIIVYNEERRKHEEEEKKRQLELENLEKENLGKEKRSSTEYLSALGESSKQLMNACLSDITTLSKIQSHTTRKKSSLSLPVEAKLKRKRSFSACVGTKKKNSYQYIFTKETQYQKVYSILHLLKDRKDRQYRQYRMQNCLQH